MNKTHRSWHSRGYLPHLDIAGFVQMLNFRLADAMPGEIIKRWQTELLSLAEGKRARELHKRIEHYLDIGYGECHLRDPLIAEMVENALLFFDGQRYRLLNWVIMPNHVHVLVETVESHPLSEILHSWKSYTAQEANKILGRKDAFWQREYFDRYIRDESHFAACAEYIHQNPVKAGLVGRAENWRFSSAWWLARQADGQS